MKNFTDEKTLLREIKNGNGEAFEFLFNSYYPRLRGYAARFVTDEEAVRADSSCFHFISSFRNGEECLSELFEASATGRAA